MRNDLTAVVAGERRKLAKVLHDGICQELTGLALIAEVHAQTLRAEASHVLSDAEYIRDGLKKAATNLRDVMQMLQAPA